MKTSITLIILAFYASFCSLLVKSFTFRSPIYHTRNKVISTKNYNSNSNEISKTLTNNIILKSVTMLSILFFTISPSFAEYDENLEWIGPPEQTWVQRIEKAKTMSRRDIFMAAKGAGNRDKLEGKESDKSKKRRAMAACRAPEFREIIKISEIECVNRVSKGENDFILDAL